MKDFRYETKKYLAFQIVEEKFIFLNLFQVLWEW